MTTGDGPSTGDRVRYLLSTHFTLAVLACLAIAVGGAIVAVGAHTGPDTTTEQQVVGTWSGESDFEHAAVVQRDARAFERGEVLPGRSTYFSSVTPILNGSYTYEYDGDADSASVATDASLVVRAVSRLENRGVLWRESEPLTTVESEPLAPNGTHRLTFAVNVTEQIAFARGVQEELGTARGRIQVMIVTKTTAGTTVAGETVVDERTERLVAEPDGGTYAMSTNVSGEHGRQITAPVDVPVETDPLRAWGSVLVALVGFAGAATLLWANRAGGLDISPLTRSTIRLQSERDTFSEWISSGRVPPARDDERVVVLDSLADLVDVAIDSDERVVADANTSAFVVLHGETRYAYWPESAAPTAPRADESTGASTTGSDGQVRDGGDAASRTAVGTGADRPEAPGENGDGANGGGDGAVGGGGEDEARGGDGGRP